MSGSVFFKGSRRSERLARGQNFNSLVSKASACVCKSYRCCNSPDVIDVLEKNRVRRIFSGNILPERKDDRRSTVLPLVSRHHDDVEGRIEQETRSIHVRFIDTFSHSAVDDFPNDVFCRELRQISKRPKRNSSRCVADVPRSRWFGMSTRHIVEIR